MSAPWIQMDAGKVAAQVDQVNKNLDAIREKYIAALTQAVVEYANDTVAEAQQACAVRTGNLKGSASVSDPLITDTQVSCVGGFNIAYAYKRDQGGPIYPSKARMLAIPLDKILTGAGVPRYSSPREEQGLFVLKLWGRVFLAKRTRRTVELHWVLKDHVDQKGDGFFSRVVEARKTEAANIIGLRTRNQLGTAI